MGIFDFFKKKDKASGQASNETAMKKKDGSKYSGIMLSASEMFSIEEINSIKASVLHIATGTDNIYNMFNVVFTLIDNKYDGDVWNNLVRFIEIWFEHGINKTEINELFVNRVKGYLSGELSGNYYEKTAAPEKSTKAIEQGKKKNILEQYRDGLAYLDSCGTFDEVKLREFNRITGNRFTEENIQNYIQSSKNMIKGMEGIKDILRDTMQEGISTFEKIVQSGIDLSKYDI